MRLAEKYDLHRFMKDVEGLVEQEDLSIFISTDFVEYRKVRAAQEGRGELATMFDAKMGFIPKDSGFWIGCKNDKGEIVHTQAVRMHDLQGESLYEHIQASSLLYVPPEAHDIEDYTIQMSDCTKDMKGTISYHGDAWIHPSLRMSKLNLILGRYGLAAAKLFWGVDTYFAFMSNENVIRGLHTRAGFFRSVPAVWIQEEQILCRYWLVWLEPKDITDLIAIPPAELHTRKSKPKLKSV